jgi:hypothetical protein
MTIMSINLSCLGPLPEDVARDIVRIPRESLSFLEISEHDYVRVWGNKGSCLIRAYSIRDKSERVIRIRATTREYIGVDIGDIVRIEAVKSNRHEKVKAHFARQDDVGKGICRLHSKIFSKLGIAEENWIEVFNPETCGRIFLRAKKHNLQYEDAILLDKYTRMLLSIDEKRVGKKEAPEIGVRKNIFAIKNEGALDHLYKLIVGYKWLSLRVVMDGDVDEGKNIVRLRKDNMLILGVRENDVADIYWHNKRVKCRVLQMVEQQTGENRSVLTSDSGLVVSLCVSERRRLGIDLTDIVKMRRSPLFVLKANTDRAIITVTTSLGLYATLLLQLKVDSSLSLGTTLIIGIMLLWLLFAKVRSEV